jgi:hypothetical protein
MAPPLTLPCDIWPSVWRAFLGGQSPVPLLRNLGLEQTERRPHIDDSLLGEGFDNPMELMLVASKAQ